MNLFLVVRNENGAAELVTPPLDDVILPGVTRDSVLALARDHASGKKRISGLPSDLVVSECPITMKEVKEKAESGNLLEVFGTGEPCESKTLVISDIVS
jgi:branched-chain amino acid aminotransferase